jgi:cathepsin A (carboxypeptidase C)
MMSALLNRFFESRTSPESDPLLMWLNGGPGCSSSTGLLFELGPCHLTENGLNTTENEHSWNTHANMIFLDQPVEVGFSYTDDGSTVNTSPVAGQDVHAFMQLFLTRFPEYASLPFHLAAESYGGTYAPNIANVVYKKNKELAAGKAGTQSSVNVNLASVILANGLTNPYIQMGSIADYVCDGPFPVYPDPEGPQCEALRAKIPTCQRLIQSCYNFNSKFTCVPAVLYCNSQLFGPLMRMLPFNSQTWSPLTDLMFNYTETGLNPYDVRKKCDRSKDGDLCYKQMEWIETWMNNRVNKVALGVNPNMDFQACNMEVNQAFTMQGDSAHNSALLLPELIIDGIRLLVYAGNAGRFR